MKLLAVTWEQIYKLTVALIDVLKSINWKKKGSNNV